jgi:hypothetical protein
LLLVLASSAVFVLFLFFARYLRVLKRGLLNYERRD